MNAPKYSLTNSSVTVVFEGKAYTYQAGTPNFTSLRTAILNEKWDDIPKCLTVASSIEQWAKGKFTVNGDLVSYMGDPLPTALNSRILEMASGGEDPTKLFLFWEKLQMNPSARSVDSLWGFMSHMNIPLDDEGNIVAYKAVRSDFKDIHSGTVDNKPGSVIEYPRNKVSDDPRCPCHEGLHVGDLSYARQYGGNDCLLLIVKVDPQHVVCVPYDESARKMRVCKYEVIGLYTGPLGNTSFDKDDAPDYEDDNYDDDDGDTSDEDPDAKGKAKVRVKKVKVVAPKAGIPSYTDLDGMDEDHLLEIPLGVLRKYAANQLKMVGASKLPGGKTILIKNILECRCKGN